jgi:hypothetical protein
MYRSVILQSKQEHNVKSAVTKIIYGLNFSIAVEYSCYRRRQPSAFPKRDLLHMHVLNPITISLELIDI